MDVGSVLVEDAGADVKEIVVGIKGVAVAVAVESCEDETPATMPLAVRLT